MATTMTTGFFSGLTARCKRQSVKKLYSGVMATVLLMLGHSMSAHADVSVQWTSPADGSSFLAGSTQTLTGVASATGTIGSGLELMLVLDSSGSMGTSATSGGVTKSRREWQAEAAIALVNSLPAGAKVGVVEFDSSANLVTGLTTLTADRSALAAAINGVDASGGTLIGAGIDKATLELTGLNHTDGFSQQMVVFSDGNSSGNPASAATNALAAGVDAVSTVILPGANVSQMQSIAAAGNGVAIDARGDLSALVNAFNGVGGVSFVGVDKVEVTLPDGSVITVPVDAFGNFTLDHMIALGANDFLAKAYGTDGSTATDLLTLYGVRPGVSNVPIPAAFPLMASALALLVGMRRRSLSARK